jgi:hypothetical protein
MPALERQRAVAIFDVKKDRVSQRRFFAVPVSVCETPATGRRMKVRTKKVAQQIRRRGKDDEKGAAQKKTRLGPF